MRSLARGTRWAALASLLLGLPAGCGGDGEGPTGGSTGAVRVTTATTGTNVDPDGYTVRLDGGSPRPVGTNAAVTISGVPAGDHSVSLEGLAANCATGDSPQDVSVAAGATAEVAFDVLCGNTPNPVLTGVSPAPLVEGQPATLTGSNFRPNPAENRVTVGGVAATVTGAGATELHIVVPSFDCQPARSVALQVSVEGRGSNIVSHPVSPAGFTTVAPGQQLLLQDAARFCLQFGPATGTENYLIAVQSTSEVITSLTPIQVTAVAAGAPTAPVLAEARPPVARASFASPRAAALLGAHRRAELALRNWERRRLLPSAGRAPRPGRPTLRTRAGAGAGVGTLAVGASALPGDTVVVRVPDLRADDPCAEFITDSTVVRAVGAHALWLEDIHNAPGGYGAPDFDLLSQAFDSPIYPTDVAYFGEPTDLDGNGRVVVVVTHTVNQFASGPGGGILGFVFVGDLFPRDFCPSSNEGEIFYSIAPDPTGTDPFGPFDRIEALGLIRATLAHEFTHTIQFGRRIAAGFPPPAIWLAEGQATLAEEVTGHAFEGRAPGRNYGFAVALNQDDPGSLDWYSEFFADLAGYFGYNFSPAPSKVAGAPEQCSWLDTPPDNGPCVNATRMVYLSWSLLRWLSDQYGPGFTGGEQGLERALLETPAVGYAAVEAVLGVPMRTLLAQWSAMLYTDDRVAGLDPRLGLASWNLYDIFELHFAPAARLAPRSRGFASFTESASVRAGSTAYFRVSGTNRSATAIRVGSPSDTPLPGIMQVFVVRLL